MYPGKQKSRTFRRVFKKSPGGKTRISYIKRKPKKARCVNCDDTLKGASQVIASKLRKIPKTKKRPQRPYGGMLCSKCSRERIIELARAEK